MTQSFDDFYWKQFDVKNKDTSLAECFGRDVWDHKQAEIDELQKRIDEALRFANDAHSDLNIGMLKMVEILRGKQDDPRRI